MEHIKWLRKMWKRDSTRSYRQDRHIAQDWISEAYRSGIINWNIYNLANDKINRAKNGSWMFEKPKNADG